MSRAKNLRRIAYAKDRLHREAARLDEIPADTVRARVKIYEAIEALTDLDLYMRRTTPTKDP